MHAHIQYVHNNCTMFEECQFKGVGGVDYTMYTVPVVYSKHAGK
jgi:hypothetical protein